MRGTEELDRPEQLLANLPPLPETTGRPGGMAVVAAFVQTTLNRFSD